MKSKFKGTLAVLVAVLAVSVVASASAFANTGELVNKEGKALVKGKFTAATGESRIESSEYGTYLQCRKGTVTGQWTSATTGTETIDLGSCTEPATGKSPCKTEGAKEEEIKLPLSLSVIPTYQGKDIIESSINGTFTFKCSHWHQQLKGGFMSRIAAEREKALSTSLDMALYEGSEYENTKGESVHVGAEDDYNEEGFSEVEFSAELPTTLEEAGKFI